MNSEYQTPPIQTLINAMRVNTVEQYNKVNIVLMLWG